MEGAVCDILLLSTYRPMIRVSTGASMTRQSSGTFSLLAFMAVLVMLDPARLSARDPALAGVDQSSVAGRWALLIGVDDYTWAKKLEYCGADMQALAAQLVSSGFPKDQVYLLHDEARESKYRPSQTNIEMHLRLILKLVEPGDFVLVAFSGHVVHVKGKSYLCPGDARLDDPKSMISVDGIYDLLRQSDASLKLLLVDACRNDPRLDGERSFEPTESTRQFATSLERPPQGILLLTSCAPGEVAREEKAFGHGVFTHFLLEGLRGKADADSNRRVSLMELYLFANSHTKKYVARRFVASQRPSLRGDIHDDFDLTQVVDLPKEITNSIGMKLVLIPAGKFMMGSSESPAQVASAFNRMIRNGFVEQASFFQDEHPRHEVTISRRFYLGSTEVTNGQFRAFVRDSGHVTDAEREGTGGGGFDPNRRTTFDRNQGNSWQRPGLWTATDDLPVVVVSWNDAQAFCRWLSAKEGVRYRLPTEAEWEYACRAGTTTRYWTGDDPQTLQGAANIPDGALRDWYARYTRERLDYPTLNGRDGYSHLSPAGRFRANPFGLHDMHGNVWEWCQDNYDADRYTSGNHIDPTGRSGTDLYVIRGGCYI
jgi:formylglycine-generating enzyme required for sulfatase activity